MHRAPPTEAWTTSGHKGKSPGLDDFAAHVIRRANLAPVHDAGRLGRVVPPVVSVQPIPLELCDCLTVMPPLAAMGRLGKQSCVGHRV